jgi:hypothetical protein
MMPYRKLLLLVVIVHITGCRDKSMSKTSNTDASPRAEFAFQDISQSAGFNVTYHNGRESRKYAILESLGGGGGFWDFDRDGNLDIFCPGGGEFVGEREIRGLPHHLHRNYGELKWKDVTGNSGCGTPAFYNHGCAIADADNDGFADLVVTGYGGLQFWKNQGDGTFIASASDSGLLDPTWSSSAGWADLNGDSFLDLYIAHYTNWSFDNDPKCPGIGPDGRDVCPPREFEGLDDVVFLNLGDGQFRAASDDIGLVPQGKGLGVLLADFDLDADIDIYVANDTTPNFLYQNDGRGTFTEIGLSSGSAVDERGQPNGSMGLALADFDSDGLPDVWVTNFEMETFALYRNHSNMQFQHISRDSGVTAVGSLYVGFGTVADDFDLDGDEDIVVLNGHVVYYPKNNEEPQPSMLLENLGTARFKLATPGPETGYFQQKHIGRGVASGDFDGDGQIDLLAIHTNQSASLLQNITETTGQSVKMRLIGRRGNRDCIGARVVLHTSDGDQLRMIYGGGSYLSQSESTLNWGVSPEVKILGATITWQGGDTQETGSWPAGSILLVEESGGHYLIPFQSAQ